MVSGMGRHVVADNIMSDGGHVTQVRPTCAHDPAVVCCVEPAVHSVDATGAAFSGTQQPILWHPLRRLLRRLDGQFDACVPGQTMLGGPFWLAPNQLLRRLLRVAPCSSWLDPGLGARADGWRHHRLGGLRDPRAEHR